MEMTGVFKDAISRQADEAVRIQARKNSKSQFNILISRKYYAGKKCP
jgi:hypothetical protein